MLSSLFDTIEEWLGPQLDTVATFFYWLAVAFLAHRVLLPAWRLRMEMLSAKLQLSETLSIVCPFCRAETVLNDNQCAICSKTITLPRSLRLWHFLKLHRPARWLMWVRWSLEALALVGFLVLTVAGGLAVHAWPPGSPLSAIFMGLAIFSWVAIASFLAQVFHLGAGGVVGRVRDALFAFAAAGVLAITLFLASQARPVEEDMLWRLDAAYDGSVLVESTKLELPSGMIGFEYLQISHKRLGYQKIYPLAFIGSRRVELGHEPTEAWIMDWLWKTSVEYSLPGLSVRRRVEQSILTPGEHYEIFVSEEQVSFRQAER